MTYRIRPERPADGEAVDRLVAMARSALRDELGVLCGRGGTHGPTASTGTRGQRRLAFVAEDPDVVGAAVVSPVRHPIDGAEEGRIDGIVCVPARRGSGLRDALLARVTAEATQLGWLALRARAGRSDADWLTARGWSLDGYYVRRCVADIPRRPCPPQGVSIALAESGDAPQVAGMLAKAIWDGLRSDERARMGQGHVARAVMRAFLPLDRPGAGTFVARAGRRLIGHATFHAPGSDEPRGSGEVELVDVFVVDEWRRAGVSAALIACGAGFAEQVDAKAIVATAAKPDGGEQHLRTLLSGLREAGWRAGEAILRLPLAG